MLEGLFNMLGTKFSPQYNQTIKLLQFGQLHTIEDEDVDEWMGRLHVAAEELAIKRLIGNLKNSSFTV